MCERAEKHTLAKRKVFLLGTMIDITILSLNPCLTQKNIFFKLRSFWLGGQNSSKSTVQLGHNFIVVTKL